ncbi:MAG: hypothetical protein ABJF88_16770 [Rhodothermales bacterium]
MSTGRRYTEHEIHALFERAAERQEQARRAEAASEGGLTLDELQRIGRETGIAPEHIAEAAVELAAAGPTRPAGKMLGMPVEVRRARAVAAPVTDEAWEQMVTDLRKTFKQPGVAGRVGRVREWATTTEENRMPVRVSVTPEDGGAHVTIEQSMRSSALGLTAASATFALVALLFGVLFAVGDFEPGVMLLPAMFAAFALLMFGGSRFGFGTYANRQAERFEHALDRIDLIARDAAPAAERSAVPTEAEPERAPRLGLDDLPEADAESSRPGRSRTHS